MFFTIEFWQSTYGVLAINRLFKDRGICWQQGISRNARVTRNKFELHTATGQHYIHMYTRTRGLQYSPSIMRISKSVRENYSVKSTKNISSFICIKIFVILATVGSHLYSAIRYFYEVVSRYSALLILYLTLFAEKQLNRYQLFQKRFGYIDQASDLSNFIKFFSSSTRRFRLDFKPSHVNWGPIIE